MLSCPTMSHSDPPTSVQSDQAATYTVTATEFRKRLFSLLEQVAAGQLAQVTIIRDGTPVAVLERARQKDRGKDRLRIARAIAAIELDTSQLLPYHKEKEGTDP
jgi:prevent-host-death family protein